MGKRILVVDDDPIYEEIIGIQLEEAGYEHLSFETPLQAMAFFRQNSKCIDLAIIDLVLPFMGGDELAKKLREIAPDLPILFVTGHIELKNIISTISKVMYKPLLRAEFIHAVEELLKPAAFGEHKAAV